MDFLSNISSKVYIGAFFVVLIIIAVYFMWVKGPPGSKSKKKGEDSTDDTGTGDNADELISIIENTPA
tara:strand:+ start:6760 stop:6963 length:204 start_codon:yes stop_codon:yes gene_type:complete